MLRTMFRSRPGTSLVPLLAAAVAAGVAGLAAAQEQPDAPDAAGEAVGGDADLPRAPLVSRLDSALRAALPPEKHGWLWAEGRRGGGAGGTDAGCPEPVYRAVRRAARRGGRASGERRYAWWLAADRRAVEDCNHWFEMGRGRSDRLARRRQAMAEVGLRYRYSELAGEWVYQRDLLRRVWEEAPETRWGHFAFALLQDMGWDTSGTCAGGNEQFGPVIEKGRRFLARREPGPFLRAVVAATVAKAHETKWSISQTTADDMGIFGYPFGPDAPRERKEGAAAAARDLIEGDGEKARRRALELYRSVRENPAAGPELRAWAEAKIGRLEAGENTHQYRYYCVYD